jgi:hypothetical protein
MSALRTMSAALALAGASGCAANSHGERAGARDVEAARQLVGVWDITITADRTAAMSATTRPVEARGAFAFVAASPSSGRLIGVCDVDIRPHHLSPLDAGVALTAEVHRVSRSDGSNAAWIDSVHILIDEGDAGYVVRLDGAIAGDSVTGSWNADSHATAGGGHFMMRRHRTDLAG